MGRCTFTTTSSPVRSVAACTWAIDAAASGSRSNAANTSSSGAPRSASTTRAHDVEGLGRHLVAALLELVDQLLGEEALARGDDLAELDVGRAEALGGDAQPPRQVGLRRASPPRRRRAERPARRAPCRGAGRCAPRAGPGGTLPGRREVRELERDLAAQAGRRPAATASRRDRRSTAASSLKIPIARSAGGSTGAARMVRGDSRSSGCRRYCAAMAGGPLAGVRVVELGVWVAGPGAGARAGRLGRRRHQGRGARGRPDAAAVLAASAGHGQTQSPPFDLDNRGKRRVVLDLRDPRRAATRCCGWSPPPTSSSPTSGPTRSSASASAPERSLLEPAPARLRQRQRATGRDGPDADRAGYDVGAFWARTGIALSITPEGEAPASIRAGLGDHVTAMTMVAGILCGPARTRTSGVGQLVETSLLRTGIYVRRLGPRASSSASASWRRRSNAPRR